MMNVAMCKYYLIHTTVCVLGGGAIYNIMGHKRQFNC